MKKLLISSLSAAAAMAAFALSVQAQDTGSARQPSFSEEELQAKIEVFKRESAVSDENLRASMEKQRRMNETVLKRTAPGYDGPDKVDTTARRTLNLPPTPQLKKPTDVAELAKYYSGQGKAAIPTDAYELMVFVSLSMPKPSLLRLAREASDAGAVLVLRGLRGNSIKSTFDTIQAIQKEAGEANWQINPPAFKKFKVEAAPTVVLAKAVDAAKTTEEGCAPAGSYVAISGDVTLEYALERIASLEPRFEDQATRYMRKIRAEP